MADTTLVREPIIAALAALIRHGAPCWIFSRKASDGHKRPRDLMSSRYFDRSKRCWRGSRQSVW
jgi:hypothetical protein